LSWQLRTATSLARLWRGQGRSAEAIDLLSSIYDRFTEGFKTRDMVDAKILLSELTQ
jgi:predicted ATPase